MNVSEARTQTHTHADTLAALNGALDIINCLIAQNQGYLPAGFLWVLLINASSVVTEPRQQFLWAGPGLWHTHLISTALFSCSKTRPYLFAGICVSCVGWLFWSRSSFPLSYATVALFTPGISWLDGCRTAWWALSSTEKTQEKSGEKKGGNQSFFQFWLFPTAKQADGSSITWPLHKCSRTLNDPCWGCTLCQFQINTVVIFL